MADLKNKLAGQFAKFCSLLQQVFHIEQPPESHQMCSICRQ